MEWGDEQNPEVGILLNGGNEEIESFDQMCLKMKRDTSYNVILVFFKMKKGDD